MIEIFRALNVWVNMNSYMGNILILNYVFLSSNYLYKNIIFKNSTTGVRTVKSRCWYFNGSLCINRSRYLCIHLCLLAGQPTTQSAMLPM